MVPGRLTRSTGARTPTPTPQVNPESAQKVDCGRLWALCTQQGEVASSKPAIGQDQARAACLACWCCAACGRAVEKLCGGACCGLQDVRSQLAELRRQVAELQAHNQRIEALLQRMAGR